MDREALARYLAEAPLLVELCTRNGWPDPDTLRIEVVEERPDSVLCNLRVEEVVTEGSGTDRIDQWGQCRVHLDAAGRIRHAEIVARQRE